jgi:hypothetical protein
MCVRIPDPLLPPLPSTTDVIPPGNVLPGNYLYLNPLVNVDSLLHVTASLSLDATIDSMPSGG